MDAEQTGGGLRVACPGFRGPKARYFERLAAWELTPTEMNAKPGTCRRWAEERPQGTAYVPRLDDSLLAAGFAGEAAEAAWAAAVERAEWLQADTVLLRTPASFRPTPANRAALVQFFKGRAGPQVAWWAEGLWAGAPEETYALAAEAGLIPVVDPLSLDDDEPLPEGDVIYWRLRGSLGMQGRFSDYDLDRLTEAVAGRRAGYVVFAAPEMWRDATRFAELLQMMDGDEGDALGDGDIDDEA